MLTRAPMRIGLTSPRTMQPNQILLCAPISVSPVTVAFVAIQASSAIVGRMPQYDISRGDSACIESAQFADVFARYLPALPQNQTVTPSQANESVAFCASSTVTPLFDVTVENPRNASVSARCDGVTDGEPFPRDDEADAEEETWTV
jgi:hypothetical protein